MLSAPELIHKFMTACPLSLKLKIVIKLNLSLLSHVDHVANGDGGEEFFSRGGGGRETILR